MSEQSQYLALSQQVDEFEQQHPEVTEAMRLFGVTMVKYQETLHSLYNPRIYQSSTTIPGDDKSLLNQ